MPPGTHKTTVLGTLNVPADVKIEKHDLLRKTFVRWDAESVDIPGIYRAGGKYFTVNVPVAESDLAGMEKEALKKILGELDTIDEKGDLKAQVAAVNGGISLEMFLANNILKAAKSKT
jgi:hypothetical protein